jgi:hypothetical protein
MDLFVFYTLSIDSPNEVVKYLQKSFGAKQIKYEKISEGYKITFRLLNSLEKDKLIELKSFANTIQVKIYDKIKKEFYIL